MAEADRGSSTVSLYWEDFEVGRRYPTYGRAGRGGYLSVFCAFGGYHVPLFIDEEYARRTPYGGRIAPSAFTMSVSTAMTEGLFRDNVVALLGVDKGRVLAPA